MWNKIFASPYLLAFLVGMYPSLFLIGNNWFMFESSHALLLFFMSTLIIFTGLSSFHLAVSWLARKFLRDRQESITQRVFLLATIPVLAYMLRHTLLPILDDSLLIFVSIVALITFLIAWLIPKTHISPLNVALGFMCFLQLGVSLDSLFSKNRATLFDNQNKGRHKTNYDQVKFINKPNVYYIVPDGYPNREALEKIFSIEKKAFYENLESLAFTIYPLALSNYMATLPSVSASLGMEHHFYEGSIGNFEMLNSRRFIVSEQNPVVHIFKNNGYQVSFVHESDYLFKSGCLVDSCFPSVSPWGELFNLFVPPGLNTISMFATATKRINVVLRNKTNEQTLLEFMPKILKHIDLMSAQSTPSFTYIHTRLSGHSPTGRQSREELDFFRKNYFKRVQSATDTITIMVQHILTRDAKALIIINADHGAWGYGNYSLGNIEMFEGLPDDLIALDHLGVLLAIRWPEMMVQGNDRDIRSNVNLFRYIFAYLSQNQDMLNSKVPDDGFIQQGQGEDAVLMKVVNDGKILEEMIDMH